MFSAPPVLPERVSQRNVLLGFEDERLEVQYRRLKALQIRFVDQVALAVQVRLDLHTYERLGTVIA